MKFNATLVVMAAGMGSRFGGLKQIAAVGKNGEAILDFSVYDAVEAGFNKVVFVINHKIEKDFKEIVGKRIENKVKVEYVFQEKEYLPQGYGCPKGREKPWGTGHAILCCKDVVNEPFAVINADDYYGKTAFSKIYDCLKNHSEDYCMVGFRLKNTLTDNGSVSRGICTVENGYLTDIVERTKIIDCKYTEDDVNWVSLPEDTVVSMNMWGFSADIFGYIAREFDKFLEARGGELKSEFYLPSVVDALIVSGEKKVRVMASEDKWYGVTYKEDKDAVVAAIGKLVDDGLYEGM